MSRKAQSLASATFSRPLWDSPPCNPSVWIFAGAIKSSITTAPMRFSPIPFIRQSSKTKKSATPLPCCGSASSILPNPLSVSS